MRHVKVMPAYLCPPLWLYEDGSDIPINVQPRDLPLPVELVARLERWNREYQDTFEDGGFLSDDALDTHTIEGIEIASEMALALAGWAATTLFEHNAELSAGAATDRDFTIVRATRPLVFDPEITRRSA